MIPINGLTASGALLLLFIVLLVPACCLISRERDRRVVFTSGPTVPGPGMCGCGAPKCTPEPAPFPGEVPVREKIPAPADAWPQVIPNPDDPTGLTFIPAPDGEGATPASEKPAQMPGYVAEEIGHDGDSDAWVESAWNRIQAGELREQLRAEAVSGDG